MSTTFAAKVASVVRKQLKRDRRQQMKALAATDAALANLDAVLYEVQVGYVPDTVTTRDRDVREAVLRGLRKYIKKYPENRGDLGEHTEINILAKFRGGTDIEPPESLWSKDVLGMMNYINED